MPNPLDYMKLEPKLSKKTSKLEKEMMDKEEKIA